MATWLVSACLLGRRCRYDGGSCAHDAVQAIVQRHEAAGGEVVAVCPEELAGLGTPRRPAQLRGGDGHAVLQGRASVRRVVDGADVTDAFVRGARLARSQAPDARVAVLKARSPSCGRGATWIDGALRRGDGVFAALLVTTDTDVRTEDTLHGL